MTIKEITQSLAEYNKLIALAKSKVEIMENVDPAEYHTSRGIATIEFGNDQVYVRCDDSCWGSQDYTSFDFPLIWLTKSDEDLIELVTMARERRQQYRRTLDQEVQSKKENEELKEFNRLKAKFGC